MLRTCQKCGEDHGVYENELGMDKHVLCRCERRIQLLMVVAAVLMIVVVALLLPKRSTGSVDVEKVAKSLRQEAKSRGWKMVKPTTEDEGVMFNYYGISPEEIRKGAKR